MDNKINKWYTGVILQNKWGDKSHDPNFICTCKCFCTSIVLGKKDGLVLCTIEYRTIFFQLSIMAFPKAVSRIRDTGTSVGRCYNQNYNMIPPSILLNKRQRLAEDEHKIRSKYKDTT